MGIARYNDIDMGTGLVHDGLLKLEYTAIHLPDDLTEIELEIQSDLVIPAPCGMELLAYRAYLINQPLLDVHVDIFQFYREEERLMFDSLPNLFQPPQNGRKLPLFEDAYLAEHLRMGDTPLDVIFVEAFIKGYRLGEFFDPLFCRPRK